MEDIDTEHLHIIQMRTDDIICGDVLLHCDPSDPYDKWSCILKPHHPVIDHEAIDGTRW
jgi:hypothetical protein